MRVIPVPQNTTAPKGLVYNLYNILVYLQVLVDLVHIQECNTFNSVQVIYNLYCIIRPFGAVHFHAPMHSDLYSHTYLVRSRCYVVAMCIKSASVH